MRSLSHAARLQQVRNPRNLAIAAPDSGPEGQVISDIGYYSRGIFSVAKDGSNNFVYPVQTLNVFGYAVGDPMTPAQSPAATAIMATDADTNLDVAGQTSDGDQFIIFGVGILLNPTSDAEVARQLWPEISVSLKTANGSAKRLGPPAFLPGGGGLQGTGRQDITAANSTVSYIHNGWPEFANCYIIKSGFRWQKQGERDSNLRVLVKLERATTVAGVAGSPANLKVDFMVRLYGRAYSKRSPNS